MVMKQAHAIPPKTAPIRLATTADNHRTVETVFNGSIVNTSQVLAFVDDDRCFAQKYMPP